MDYVGSLMSARPLVKKYQVAASMTLTGIPHLQPAANGTGVAQATTTSAANMIGCNLDTVTYATGQITGGDPAALASFIINPDAIWKALLSGGSTSGTALTARTVATASTTGLSVTTTAGDDWSSPTMDEGSIWGYDGANAGILRKITSVSSNVATVIVAFPNDTVVGDNFLFAPYTALQANTMQLTADLTQADASIAVGTGAAFRCVEIRHGSLAGEGKTNSFGLFVSDDHIFNVTT